MTRKKMTKKTYREKLSHYRKQTDKNDKAEKQYTKKIERLCSVRKTRHVSDFESVQSYLNKKFPNIDISHIPIYVVSHDDMSKTGVYGAHGYYDKIHKSIFIRKPHTAKSYITSRFDKVMQKFTKSTITVEDIVVHECIHAISQAANRSTNNLRQVEEEFAFTNCIDFYRSKGMTDKDIAQNIFLPFCINNVMDNKGAMISVLEEVRKEHVSMKSFGILQKDKKYGLYLSVHAKKIVPIIVKKGMEQALHMIDLYEKYGRGVELSDTVNQGGRFASIDMDDEWSIT